MRIRTRLLILVLAVLIPAFIAAALGIAYIYNEQQKSFEQNMRETTRALALVLDKEIAKREDVLRTLAASPDIDQGDFKNFYAHAATVAAMWDSTIYLADTSGRQLMDTRLPLDTPNLPSTAALTNLHKQYGADASIVSNLYIGELRKQPRFAVQLPVKRHGRVLYYVGMGSEVKQLQSVFKEQRLPTNWIGTILDREGKVVARSQEPENYVGKQVSMGFARQFSANTEGFYDAVSLSGVPVYAFFNRAPNSGWIFVVNVPKSMMLATVINATVLMGSISLLLLGLSVVAALAVARNTARPIEALRVLAERLGRGEPISAERSGLTETMEVSVAMAHASRQITTAQDELQRRVEEAVEAAERSQRALLQGQKLEALGRLTGGIAHDFNNVLQTLTTSLQVAYLLSKDAKVKSSLEVCQRAVRRAIELISQLMAFGRVQDARLETVAIPAQVNAMLPLLKGGLRSDVIFRTDIPDDLWPVTLDPLQLELALLNLTINARDAMPSGGMLQLRARNEVLHEALDELPAGDYVKLMVIDSGEGMHPEVLAKALDPFFTTKSVGKGTGMGLAQAYGFAKQTGGTLLLDSQPGEGTWATLYLPRASLEKTSLPQTEQGLPRRAISNGAILFVEDDPLVREAVAPALTAAGFNVMIAHDGEEALAMVENGKPVDLVFSDIVMPGKISGIDLARTLQSRHPHIRVVLATGYSDHRVSLPDVCILSKPYEINDVVDALNTELQADQEEKMLS